MSYNITYDSDGILQIPDFTELLRKVQEGGYTDKSIEAALKVAYDFGYQTGSSHDWWRVREDGSKED